MVRESAKTTKVKEAEALLETKRNAVKQGQDPTTQKISNPTFAKFSEEYLTAMELQKGHKNKALMVNQLVREFGNLKLNDFSVQLLEQFQARLLTHGLKSESSRIRKDEDVKCYKPATANRFMATLKHMFSKADAWGCCTEEALKRVRRVKLMKENNQRTEFLSVEQCNDLLKACDLVTSSRYLKPIVNFALHTGCRREEIVSLKWDNVDMIHSRIVLMDTKNGDKRIIPVNSNLMETLKGLVRKLHSPYVFSDEEGKRYLGGRVMKTFNAVCKRAGLIGYHLHDLRHTYASHLVMAGVDITTVSRLMGHKSLTMTLRYSHLAKDHLDTAVNLLADRMNGLTSQSLHINEKKELRYAA